MKKIIYSMIVIGGLAACQTIEKPGEEKAGEKLTTVNPVEETVKPAVARKAVKRTNRNANTDYSSAPQKTGSYEIPSENAAMEPAKKKGWSDAAKGAVIGGVVGAGAGAVIDKNKRGRGAIIGGVVGAGAGYAIGRSRDRKSGRVQSGGGLIPSGGLIPTGDLISGTTFNK